MMRQQRPETVPADRRPPPQPPVVHVAPSVAAGNATPVGTTLVIFAPVASTSPFVTEKQIEIDAVADACGIGSAGNLERQSARGVGVRAGNSEEHQRRGE
jgi:hypothetical protein